MASRVYRNKAISKAIREHGVCCITGAPNPAPHHIIGHGYSGMGTKAPDWAQMALSHELHQELHDKGWKSFEDKYGVTQKRMVAMTLSQLHIENHLSVYDLPIESWVLEEMENLAYEL